MYVYRVKIYSFLQIPDVHTINYVNIHAIDLLPDPNYFYRRDIFSQSLNIQCVCHVFKSIVFPIYKVLFINAAIHIFHQFRFSCARSYYNIAPFLFLSLDFFWKSLIGTRINQETVPPVFIFYTLLIAGNVFILIVTCSRSFGGCYPKWKIKSHAQRCTIWRAASYISLRSVHWAMHLLFLLFLRSSNTRLRFADQSAAGECTRMNCSYRNNVLSLSCTLPVRPAN